MKTFEEMTDEELFDTIREQVNLSRNSFHGHDRNKTREIAKEMKRRGWKEKARSLGDGPVGCSTGKI